MTNEELLSIFKKSGALLDGHFQLTSGLHSAQYFQCAKVLQYPAYSEAVCQTIAERFKDVPVNVVIAPAIGGIVVAQEVGRLVAGRRRTGDELRVLFTERKENAMQLRRGFEINAGEHVLVCEDVVTTGGSVVEVIKIVKERGGIVDGVGVIVDRSGGTVDFGCPLTAAMTMKVVTYRPEDCPLCRQNIPIDKPGSRGAVPAISTKM